MCDFFKHMHYAPGRDVHISYYRLWSHFTASHRWSITPFPINHIRSDLRSTEWEVLHNKGTKRFSRCSNGSSWRWIWTSDFAVWKYVSQSHSQTSFWKICYWFTFLFEKQDNMLMFADSRVEKVNCHTKRRRQTVRWHMWPDEASTIWELTSVRETDRKVWPHPASSPPGGPTWWVQVDWSPRGLRACSECVWVGGLRYMWPGSRFPFLHLEHHLQVESLHKSYYYSSVAFVIASKDFLLLFVCLSVGLYKN